MTFQAMFDANAHSKRRRVEGASAKELSSIPELEAVVEGINFGVRDGCLFAHVAAASDNETMQALTRQCESLNRAKLAATLPLEEVLSRLSRSGCRPHFLAPLRTFLVSLPKLSKQKKHEKIVANPDEHFLVRPIDDSQVTALHLLTRNALFMVVGDRERRQKYMEVSSTTGDLLDKVVNRDFYGWGGNTHFVITGPIVCTYDQDVFYACLRLHHEVGFKGLSLSTNFHQLWKAMGNKSVPGGAAISTMKRSLERLQKISVSAKSKDQKRFWAGGLIDSVQYAEGSSARDSSVRIRLNDHMVTHYLAGAYGTLQIEHIHSLRAYARRIYEFLLSHEQDERRMTVEKWREVLGFSPDMATKVVNQRIREAVQELIEKEILMPESGLQKAAGSTVIVTILNAAIARRALD